MTAAKIRHGEIEVTLTMTYFEAQTLHKFLEHGLTEGVETDTVVINNLWRNLDQAFRAWLRA